MKRIAWFILFLILGVSCLDQPDCYRQNLNLIGISYRKLYDGKADTVVLYEVSGDGYSLYPDTVVATNGIISIALNYLNKNNEMTLAMKGFLRDDVLKLGFISRPQFVSEECGERFIVSDLKVLSYTGLNADSIRVISNVPSNPAGTNIVIYRCPRTNTMRFNFRQLYMDNDSLGKEDKRIIKTIAINSSTPQKHSNTPVSSVTLPLDPTTNSIAYNFKFDSNPESNISFEYEKGQRVILDKCGVQDVFGQLKVLTTNFPLIKVVNDSIYDPPFTNVVSYSCPLTNQITAVFREKKGDARPALVTITGLSADYPVDLSSYVGKTVSSAVLPLNPSLSSTSTTFTFQIGDQSRTLVLNYSVEGKQFHKGCGVQPVFTTLTINQQSAGFSSQAILDASVKFPTVNNVEIIP